MTACIISAMCLLPITGAVRQDNEHCVKGSDTLDSMLRCLVQVVYGCANDRFGGCGSILSIHQSGCGGCGGCVRMSMSQNYHAASAGVTVMLVPTEGRCSSNAEQHQVVVDGGTLPWEGRHVLNASTRGICSASENCSLP